MSKIKAVSITEIAFETRNNLPEPVRAQVIRLLNQRLADAIDLGTQAKQAHWNVKGPHFIGLHKLFDDVHGAVDEYADLLAERVVQLGGVAEGTARQVVEISALPEYPHAIGSSAEHVHALSGALAAFGGHMRRAIDETVKYGDQVASDVCTEIARGVDKWLWFVEAHGQNHEAHRQHHRGFPAATLESNGRDP